MPAPLNQTLQALAAGFQDLGASMRDLARGQNRMLMMLDQAASSTGPIESLEEARRRAMGVAANFDQNSHMSVDENQDDASPQSWTEVRPESDSSPAAFNDMNPNAEDLP